MRRPTDLFDREAEWADLHEFASDVLGPHFEELSREFARRFATATTPGGETALVGPAVVNDAARRTQHEVDVVAVGRDRRGASIVRAIGEAKYSREKRSVAGVARLEGLRDLIARKHPSATASKLLLFSAFGFDPTLTRAAAERDDLELVDMERLYRGG